MSSIRKKRAKEHEEHIEEQINESWLIPYADLLTLLLALFVVLYTASTINHSKYYSIMEAFNTELTGKKGGDHQSGPKLKQTKPAPPVTEYKSENQDQQLDHLKQQLEAYISEKQLQAVVTLENTKKGVEVSLKDMILFDSGKAVLKESSFQTLNDFIGLINTVPNPISIEGHTDNVPIHNSAFSSNWELSAARASSVLHYFESHQVKPERMQFTGFGEYRPLYPNDTSEHRQANRRVTIVVLRNN
jgi:chemotaxis protein MotB